MSVNHQIFATAMQAAQTQWEVLSALVWMASLEMADSIVQVNNSITDRFFFLM